MKFFLLAGWIALPLLITKIIGFSYTPQHFARYIIYVLPVIILLIVYGLDGIMSLLNKKSKVLIMPLCAGILACTSIPGLSAEFQLAKQFSLS